MNMNLPMHSNKSVDLHNFAMTPSAQIPRSSFIRESTHKTTFDPGYLIPIYVDEVLPGDTFSVSMTAFARLATPLFPIMDNLHLDSQFWFVPLRLIWTNFVKMMGEQANPGDSISYTTPQIVSPAGGWAVNSLQDYLGWPTVGSTFGGAATISTAAFATRAYNLIWREWYRDQNMQNSPVVDTDDGPDTATDYVLLRRGKRHDYFTSALPSPQRGTNAVALPLGTTAPVSLSPTTNLHPLIKQSGTHAIFPSATLGSEAGTAELEDIPSGTDLVIDPNGTLYADLSLATAATINQLRLAFQTQKVLERDARGGTRYTEIIRSHFGVISPDARLQRPEYLGGGTSPVTINPTVQTSGTSASGTTTPMGTLAAVGASIARGHGFTQSFTEHGIIIGLISVRADLTYQQGLRRMYSRNTRYDYYLPAFAMLGEQAILNKEIYCVGTPAQDDAAFGYIPRWDEMRYRPSMITGLFRSTAAGTLDAWHLAQNFTALPTLNTTFIQDTPPLQRVLATAAQTGKMLIIDTVFKERVARPLPMHSVPGMIDHF